MGCRAGLQRSLPRNDRRGPFLDSLDSEAEWCEVARQDGHPALVRFAEKLERHQYGIISHCKHQIHTSKLEGVNNKIKVVKRIAYGFHDLEYFALKVKQALPGRFESN
ncbi:MAG: transposase [Phycisphaerae bacterium]